MLLLHLYRRVSTSDRGISIDRVRHNGVLSENALPTRNIATSYSIRLENASEKKREEKENERKEAKLLHAYNSRTYTRSFHRTVGGWPGEAAAKRKGCTSGG